MILRVTRPPSRIFTYIRPAGVFFRRISASPIFFWRIFGHRFFSANPAEIRRLRPAATTKGYFYDKDPLYLYEKLKMALADCYSISGMHENETR